jgi:hypothetical protein
LKIDFLLGGFMMIHTLISLILGLGLLILSHHGYAQSISLFLNQATVSVGEPLEVAVAANREEIAAAVADVYLAVQFPDGSLYYFQSPEAISTKNQIAPLVRGWNIQTLSPMTLIFLEVPRKLPAGTYKWYLTLCQIDQDVAQPANWIANTSAQVVLINHDDGNISLEEESEPISSKATTSTSAGRDVPAAVAPPSSPDGYFDDSGEVEASREEGVTILPFPPADLPTKPSLPIKADIPVQSGTLTAGDIDDNLNFTAFQRYLDKQSQADNNKILPIIKVSDRLTLQVVNAQGQGINQARIRLNPVGQTSPIMNAVTGSNGYFYLFPQFDDLNYSRLDLQISPPEDALASPTTFANTALDLEQDVLASPVTTINTTLDLEQLEPNHVFTFTLPNTISQLPPALDLMFVIDTTGSMSDELHYITTEIRDIISQVHDHHPQVLIRFGLVVYRDEGDEYVVKSFDFTDSLNLMQIQLSEQRAQAGGDYPEAMEQALAKAVDMQWRDGNIARLLFLVADAPPHDGNLAAMLAQVRHARQKGLRIYSLAASGVADTAEWMLRVAALLTQARYLFLTDDSGVGYSHAEPKVACYLVTRLDQLISRVIAGELAGQRFEPNETEIIRQVGTYQAGVCQNNVTPAN